jgi:uncharacterized cupredoxin-like copper-binding protein
MNARKSLSCLCAVALLGVVAPATLVAHEAHDDVHFVAGEPGNPKQPFRTVLVTMRDSDGKMSFVPSTLEVKRGEQVKFIITNAGAITHEFVLADTAANLKHAAMMQKNPDMEHDDPNGKTVQSGKKTEILWKFTKAGTFEFACNIPGHRESGMLGSVTVK